MKSTLLLPVFILTILQAGCSKEEEPAKNTTVELDNQSNERIAVPYIGFDSDSTKLIADIPGTLTSPLVHIEEDSLIIKPGQTAEVHSFADQSVKRSLDQAGGLFYYVINIDTLKAVPWEDIRKTNRGVTIYFFRNYQRLEADSFRIVYPR